MVQDSYVVAASAPTQTTFSIAGIITLPIRHASTVATVGVVFTMLYLLDLLFDINPLKDMYVKAFPPAVVSPALAA